MFSVSSQGSFNNTEQFLKAMSKLDIMSILNKNGREGVSALSSVTPLDTGRAASSWNYEIKKTSSSYTLAWTNSNIENGFPVVVMLQYGYGTGTGGFVQGEDFINPAIRPIFDRIVNEIWKAVITA